MGLYNWMLEYRWGPVKTDLAAESERIRRQIREAKERRVAQDANGLSRQHEPHHQPDHDPTA